LCTKRDSRLQFVQARLRAETEMSKLNGDRARFQKDRRRKLLRRARLHVVMARLQRRFREDATSAAASLHMHDEGGPVRHGD
jgi:hypothetical protein